MFARQFVFIRFHLCYDFQSLDSKERMAIKKGRLLGLVFLLAAALAAADWQAEFSRRIARESEYPLLVENLQKEFLALAEGEKAAVSLIIGYCQSRLNDPRAELFWMRKCLEDFKAADVKIGFVPAALPLSLFNGGGATVAGAGNGRPTRR
jgi:hypothetical protein